MSEIDKIADLRIEELNGEIVVLDTEAALVHRLTGETAEAVRGEADLTSRRAIIRAAIAMGVAAGVTTLALPTAAAAASGGGVGPADNNTPPAETLAKPTGVIVTGTLEGLFLDWNPVAGATQYKIDFREVGAETYEYGGIVTDTYWTRDYGIEESKIYEVLITARDTRTWVGSEPLSSEPAGPFTGSKSPSAPPTPENNADASLRTSSSISVRFPGTNTAGIMFEVQYRRTREFNDEVWFSAGARVDASGPALAYVPGYPFPMYPVLKEITGLDSDTGYDIRWRAVKTVDGQELYSGWAYMGNQTTNK